MKTYLICRACKKAYTTDIFRDIYAERFYCPECGGFLEAEQLTEYDGKADYDAIVRIIQCLAHEDN